MYIYVYVMMKPPFKASNSPYVYCVVVASLKWCINMTLKS